MTTIVMIALCINYLSDTDCQINYRLAQAKIIWESKLQRNKLEQTYRQERHAIEQSIKESQDGDRRLEEMKRQSEELKKKHPEILK